MNFSGKLENWECNVEGYTKKLYPELVHGKAVYHVSISY